MTKFNSYLKSKIKEKRKKKIERIEKNLDRGKFKFIFLYGVLLWTPVWLIVWIFLLDIKFYNIFLGKEMYPLMEIWTKEFLFKQLLRIPIALFLGYMNAVSHWHYLQRRLHILKNKLSKT